MSTTFVGICIIYFLVISIKPDNLVSGQICTNAERIYVKDCINCVASPTCGAGDGPIGANVSVCRQACSATPTCLMGEVDIDENDCYIYIRCTEVAYTTDSWTTVRRSCTSDCLKAFVTKHEMMRGVCSTIPVGGGVVTDTEEKCLSACLDTTGCRGITWSAGNSTCELHDCDTTIFEDVLSFTSITCLDTTTTTMATTPTTTTTTMMTTTMTEPTTSSTTVSPVPFRCVIRVTARVHAP